MPAPRPKDELPRLGGRRRAVVLAATAVGYVALPAALFGDRVGLQTGARVAGAVVATLGFAAIMAALAPQRRAHVERTAGAPPGPLRDIVLFMLVVAVGVVPVWHFLTGMPWAVAVGGGAGMLAYGGVFHTLARIQRRGISPWLRPAGYGFALAGVAGGLVWAAVAGARPVEG
jgi:hypothetical protein